MRKFIVNTFVLFFLSGICFSQEGVKELIFPEINSGEPNQIKTLKSLKKTDNLYMMTYYGDYDSLLDAVNEKIINQGTGSVKKIPGFNFGCSMFAAFGDPDSYIYGRNFDNPDCAVLMTKYTPSDGYASIGFSRMNDFGFDTDDDILSLPPEERKLLLNAPFFTPDGMNERGVTAALAALRSVQMKNDKNVKSIFVTYLIREILDHAGTVEEAAELVKSYEVYDNNVMTLSHHLLIADPSGKSVIMEYSGGKWRELGNKNPWQVITNSPLYNVSMEQRKKDCRRYKTAHEELEKITGKADWNEGMDILKNVSVRGTQWSTVCDMIHKEIYISVFRDYDSICKVVIK